VTIHEHLDTTISIRFGPRVIGRFDTDGKRRGRVEKPAKGAAFPLSHRDGDGCCPSRKTKKAGGSRRLKPKTGQITC
jgi:hypothetical protein